MAANSSGEADKKRASSEIERRVDPVDEASRESFPGSDAPGWISQRAEDLETDKLDTHPTKRLKQLAASENPDYKVRYQDILNKRDQVLTRALVETAQMLIKDSGYVPGAQTNANQNNQQAIAALEEYLSKSSIPEIDQRLLALVGTGALFGWKVEMPNDDDVLRLYPTGDKALDSLIMLRLARALYRSPDQEPLLWPIIDSEIKTDQDADLVKAAIRAVLEEIPMNNLEGDMGKMIVNSVMGG